ncbi:hypothetical protein ACFPM0_14705 [Pseudonocardia sulfidoxydans]
MWGAASPRRHDTARNLTVVSGLRNDREVARDLRAQPRRRRQGQGRP